MGSYSSHRATASSWVREAAAMVRSNFTGRASPAGVGRHVENLRAVEAEVRAKTGIVVENLKVLDIGAGQLASHLLYFGVHNEAVGIDLDVFPRRWRPLDWLTLLRRNGLQRLAKTAGRRIMRVDARYRRELAKALGVRKLGEPRVLYMDAARMTFADDSFDFVYSFDVFEHIAHPRETLKEVVRVLKSGGALYVSLQHWTSDNGCHDLRVINQSRTDLPHWAHLRPSASGDFQRDAYCNELSVAAWRELFQTEMPGTIISMTPTQRPELRAALAQARKMNELNDLSDEELLAPRLTAIWQKP